MKNLLNYELLRIAFATSNRFSMVVFSLSFVSRYFSISSLIFSLTHWLFPGHVWIPQRSSPPGLRFPYKMVSHSSDSHLTLLPAHPLPLINET